jgi:hypothetical protein
MPIATRGRKKVIRAVRVNQNLHYGFKGADITAIPGISQGDATAIGQKEITQGLGLVVFSPDAPRPAQFTKKLSSGLQRSVTAFGDGFTRQAIARAIGAGWKLKRPVFPLALGITKKSREIVVSTTNNLYFAYYVPLIDATAKNGAMLGWIANVGAVTLSKTARAPKGVKIPLVTKDSRTLPCSPAKLGNALADGWKITRAERGLATLT